jgi:UDP-N-acetylglucosamine--N-acetylmuramyl-(pentapeptide) pyrophosphoryl-undecaprenol N-acetylglucosamine transferase
MKILFTGGGSGGHFYPIIAIAGEVLRIANEERIIMPQLFFMAPEPYDEGLLFENHIAFIKVPTGKLRQHELLKNVFDVCRTACAVCRALVALFRLYPDVVVGKGGFGSFPALFAARFWGIPVFIHESDAVPGKVNRWAGKFAKRIAVSFAPAAAHFPKERTAYTGNPLRREILETRELPTGREFALEKGVKTIFVTGGSLGSTTINEAVLQTLTTVLTDYQIVHQTGTNNLSDMKGRASVLLKDHPRANRYHPVGYLSASEVAAAGARADLIISRAGSTIFEIAAWGKPAILIPITESNGDHQRENAYAYAESGAADVLEEANLTVTILRDQIHKILSDEERARHMSERAQHFAKTDAAEVIAREVLRIALAHEK